VKLAGVLLLLAALAGLARAQEGMFLTEEQAPNAVFPDADRVVRRDVDSTPALRERINAHLSGSQPSLWEERYTVFDVSRGGTALGRALVVEEVGKFRPIIDPETSVGTLGLRDIGASVSATFGIDGKAARRVAHIIDPRSGRPLEDDAVAVVASPSATDAEAFTKAVLVWGHGGVQRARARGAAAAIRVTPGAIQADVGAPVVWKPLPARHTLAAREEPLR
jgi:hypothetical protein